MVALSGCGVKKSVEETSAADIVASGMYYHALNFSATDLETRKNPDGEGVFVFAEKTKPTGISAKALWIVFQDKAYPLNTVAKQITPQLKWPREVHPKNWDMTGIDLYYYHKPMQWIFG